MLEKDKENKIFKLEGISGADVEYEDGKAARSREIQIRIYFLCFVSLLVCLKEKRNISGEKE